jgi:hypothetical protein
MAALKAVVKLLSSELSRPVRIESIGVEKPRAQKVKKSSPRAYQPWYGPQESLAARYWAAVRKACIFLVLAGAVAAFATNQYQVRTEAEIMARHLAAQLKSVGAGGKIQKNTENYQKEVDGIVEKN